jgi:ketosteroid isomerase-like protein
MRRIILVAFLFAFPVSPVFAQTPTKSTEEVILQLTRDWLSAEERRDRAKLREIIADDFQGTAPMGHTVYKADVIPEEGSESGGLAISPSNLKARIFGDTAIVTAHGVQKAGEKRELRFTVVFAKRNDRWQMVAGHLSPILARP